ncbi:MAG: cation:proton antiporter [Acidobacteriota bacterium]
MTVPLLFALIGGVILIGFLANLLFRLTRIPSVLLLVAIGVVMGPVTGWIRSDELITIAPFFGALALLVILFEGGLELEIGHVVRHAPRAAVLAVVVFGLSMASVAVAARYLAGLSWLTAFMLGAILGAISPAIALPVVSGLSVRDEVKTIVKLEAAIGEVLLIVSVVLLIDSHATGAAGAMNWAWGFGKSLFVALVVASVAGVLWSRLIGWIGREPLAYMLTLGMLCLLYFAVEELGGSPAIAALLFGLMLANMQAVAGHIGPRFRELFGVDIREEQFVLNQFMVNITSELSFLIRTFFFVYLGLLLDFSTLSWTVTAWAAVMFVLLLASRRAGLEVFKRGGGACSPAELQTIMALQPRGLATAVVAFMPLQAGVAGTELFPLYAFLLIILSNLYMTAGIVFAERRLKQTAGDVVTTLDGPPIGEIAVVATKAPPDLERAAGGAADKGAAAEWPVPRPVLRFSPATDFADEPTPATFTDWMARFFGLRLEDRETEFVEMIRASYLSDTLFWVQAILGAAICALGLILDQTVIIVGAALIVPIARPVIGTGLALASGDIYLLVKLGAKLFGFGIVAVMISLGLLELLPFGATTAEIAARTRPTILDFLVAFLGGMSGAALASFRSRVFHYLPGAVIAITLLPPLCVMGFGVGEGLGSQALKGGGLQFTANIFAAVLGASIIVMLVGIPRAAQAESIRRWKEQELARPLVQAIFGRLKLQAVIGRTGSVRARLIVVGIFLLSILIPLQSALNQLTLEFRTRQAIARAQSVFEIAGRSAVLNSSFALRDEVVQVRLQVATNELFVLEDIRRFEERVVDQLGRPARLDLVQTLSEVGQADTIRSMLLARSPSVPPVPRTLSESLQETGALAERVIAGLPLPDTLRVVTARGTLGVSSGPAIELVYLADRELGEDAQIVIASLLAERTSVGQDRIRLRWVPAVVSLALSRTGRVAAGAEADLKALTAVLAEFPELAISIDLPSGLSDRAAEAAQRQIVELLGDTAVNATVTREGPSKSVAVIRLSR